MLTQTTLKPYRGPAGRIANFSAGPAALPLTVLEKAQADLVNWNGSGMSVMEMSHRSKHFEAIITQAEADLRRLLGLTDDFAVMFLQGGATLQFAMLPMNLRARPGLAEGAGGPGQSADYLVNGAWGQAAVKEAGRLGAARVAHSTEADGFSRVSRQSELQLDPQAAYLHFTSNETIHGVEYFTEPQPPDGVPLVCDVSSDLLSRPLDMAKYSLIYGGAQKNVGPAGVTMVVMRRDLLARTPAGLPLMLDYRLMAEKQSLYNTPPAYGIYIIGLVLQWLTELGGLAEIERRNTAKAALVYDAIDASGGFYRGHAQPQARSRMNVTFRLPTEALEKQFAKEAAAHGLDGLKGHRSVGGIRASIYNAMPADAVEALAQFMREFQRVNG